VGIILSDSKGGIAQVVLRLKVVEGGGLRFVNHLSFIKIFGNPILGFSGDKIVLILR